MGGFNKLGGLAIDARVRINQVGGIQLVTAGVTLVATSAFSATDRAGAFDVAVGQRASG
ncbi:Uncharacterised protein [Chlamydia trachomatis]|nr:Uncharacterised protein [Chlamydia trachomatis]